MYKLETTGRLDFAGTEPVTLQEVKDYLRISYDTENTMISRMIRSVREWVEDYLQSSLVDHTITALFSELEEDAWTLDLPFGPHASITSVKRLDMEGTETALTLNSGYYKTGLTDLKIRLVRSWSSGGWTGADYSYKVVFTTTGTVPGPVKEAILQILEDTWSNRGEGSSLQVKVSHDAVYMLNPYRRKTWL